MGMRKKLIELLADAMPSCYSDTFASQIADHLIATGVIVLDEKDVTLTVTRNVGNIDFDYEAEDV